MSISNWIFLFLLLMVVQTGAVGKNYLENQEFMELATAIKRYGTAPFLSEKFKSASSELRAKMAVRLIQSKAFVGKTGEQVRTELGDFTGVFFSDRVPAYLIEEGWRKGQDTWQLVFLLNNNGKISEVKIHKNCCTKTKR